MNTDVPIARAIDVGYFNVKYTSARHGEQVRFHNFPAIAPVLQRGEVRSIDDAPALDGFAINVEGQKYFVGRGAAAATKGVEPRRVTDEYCRTPQYRALTLGALAYMAQAEAPESDIYEVTSLVLGLPLTSYYTHRVALEQVAVGDHVVPGRGGRDVTVRVRSAKVLVQPGGALINYAVRNGGGGLTNQTSCVLDPGGGTLDWFVTQSGLTPAAERCGAFRRAMLAGAAAVAERFGGSSADNWRNSLNIMNRIDRAIHERATIVIQGRRIEHEAYWPIVQGVIDEGLNEMIGSIGVQEDLELVLCVGGGGKLYAERLARVAPKLQSVIRTEEDPLYTNLRGFQVVAERHLQSYRRAAAPIAQSVDA
jgi:plasmid segregation protein ParM